jgi:hypothetical protein
MNNDLTKDLNAKQHRIFNLQDLMLSRLDLSNYLTGHKNESVRSALELLAYNVFTNEAQLMTLLGVTNKYYVDGTRTDSYTATGSMAFPYLTIQAAISAAQVDANAKIALATQAAYDQTRYLIHVLGSKDYADNLTIGNMKYLGIILNGATITGTVTNTTTMIGGAVTDYYSKLEFIGIPSTRAYRGRCGAITGNIILNRNNDSFHYVNFTGVEVAGNVQVGTPTVPTDGTFVLGCENSYFSGTGKYISEYTILATSHILLEASAYNIFKCKLAKQDNSATKISFYNVSETDFSGTINITPVENGKVRDTTFSGTVSIVAAKTLTMDASSYKYLQATTLTSTGITFVAADGILPTATELDLAGKWLINTSGALVPYASYNIGNLAINPGIIYAEERFVLIGKLADDTYGRLSRKFVQTTHTLINARKNTIVLNAPAGCKIIGAQLRNDTLIAGVDDATGIVPIIGYDALYKDGAIQVINTVVQIPLAVDTKFSKFFDVNTDTDIATLDTDITVDAGIGNKFTAGGIISAIIYYEELTNITNV